MEKILILPDVTCDLSSEMREYFNLTDYIRSWVHINDKSYATTLDWEQISHADFHKALSDKRVTVSSAAASPETYYETFKRYIEDGYSVISMSISGTISGTYGIAATAANRIKEDFPTAKIYCVDTQRMSGSFGLLVGYACQLRDEGKTFEEIVAWLEENKGRAHQMGPIDDLTFIARRGRISKGKAFMGNLAGVKPMGDCNTEGYTTVLGKAKGMKKALNATVEYVKMMATDLENQFLIVLHSDREAYALQLKEKLETLGCKKVFVGDVFSACATNVGPGLVSVYFLGEPISAECEKEKQALLAALTKE